MMKLITNFFNKEDKIKSKYIESGLILGDIMTYPYMGKPVEYLKYLNNYNKYEEKIISMGYIPVSLNNFMARGGWGKDVSLDLLKGTHDKKNKLKELNKLIIKEYEMITDNPFDFYEVEEDNGIIKGRLKDD